MVHLNELKQKFSDKGLVVVAVAAQSKSAVEAFIEEFGVTYPTITTKYESLKPYSSGGVPHAHLIDTNGRILWSGNPGGLGDSTIEEALANTKILPAWPEDLTSVKKAFLKDKYAEALEKLAKDLERGRIEEADVEAAEGIRDWLTWYAESSLEGAAQASREGRYYEAALTYEHIAELYKRHAYEEKAETALDELLSDDDRKAEVKAGEKLAKILEKIADLKPKKALLKLRPMLSKRYAETAAGKKAAKLAEKLEAEVD